jgi:hypothetical protein
MRDFKYLFMLAHWRPTSRLCDRRLIAKLVTFGGGSATTVADHRRTTTADAYLLSASIGDSNVPVEFAGTFETRSGRGRNCWLWLWTLTGRAGPQRGELHDFDVHGRIKRFVPVGGGGRLINLSAPLEEYDLVESGINRILNLDAAAVKHFGIMRRGGYAPGRRNVSTLLGQAIEVQDPRKMGIQKLKNNSTEENRQEKGRKSVLSLCLVVNYSSEN